MSSKSKTPSKVKDFSVVSLFSGAGGLDKGFELAGFKIVYANEHDRTIWPTYEANFRNFLDKRDIREVKSEEIPDCLGIIGGPPCQSWSSAGSKRGISDPRGKLFHEYIRIIREKRPYFFIAENVPGMLSPRNARAVSSIVSSFRRIGYKVTIIKLNAADYGVPQNRKRVIFFGCLDPKKLVLPVCPSNKVSLESSIKDLEPTARPFEKGKVSVDDNEYYDSGFSSIYMSRNRRKGWNDQSYTIQAGGRHAPLHPSSPPMVNVGPDKWAFSSGKKAKVRRLTVRECARIQTFPDTFLFKYSNILDGYKMVGNAVPVLLARIIAKAIKEITVCR